MAHNDENEAISALSGFSLNHLLGELSLPSGSGLQSQLGIGGVSALSSEQIYNNKWTEDEGAVGAEEGDDWEDEVDRELREEEVANPVKIEVHSPGGFRPKQKRTRVVKRLIERPKTVYERFPSFEKDKVLDFSDLFKGYTARKSRLSRRPFLGECFALDELVNPEYVQSRLYIHGERR